MRPLTDATLPRLRVGCCGSMIAPATDPVGIEIVEALAASGFDYIELSLRDLAALPEPALAQLSSRLERAKLGCEVCNNFFPPEIRLTGPAADLSAALHYARAALSTAARFGTSVVVFGSSGARNVPAGFPREAAWGQLRDLLRHLGPIAEDHGVTLAIEHLNRQESNILNSVAECWQMAQEVAHPRVRLLIDSYHLLIENESLAILSQVASAIAHIHIAQGTARDFPAGRDAPLAALFERLGAIGYAQRCSVEGYTRDFAAAAPAALAAIREYSQPRAGH
jgi:D-psicose/D-tagatose/L-ribulose 3-epimerase